MEVLFSTCCTWACHMCDHTVWKQLEWCCWVLIPFSWCLHMLHLSRFQSPNLGRYTHLNQTTTDHSIEWSLPTGGMRLGAPLQQNIIINNSKIFGNVFWCLKFLVVFFCVGVAPESINELCVKLCDAKFLALPPFSQGCFCLGWGMGGIWMVLEKTMFANVRVAQPSQGVLKCRFPPRELKEKGSFQGFGGWDFFFTCWKMSAGWNKYPHFPEAQCGE